MTNKEEVLKHLLKILLEERLSRLENRNLVQMKDLKLEKDAYKKQELLVNKYSTIKIEPKKQDQNKKNNTNNKSILRGRDKTPNNLRTRRKNSLKKEIKQIKSKTPDIAERKRRPERKEKISITNAKNEKKISKATINKNHNIKIPGYMMPLANKNNNNNRKSVDRSSRTSKPIKKALTPDVKKRNTKNSNVNKKKVNKNTEQNMNNLNLIDLKEEDMKEHINIQEKEEKKEEQKEEEKTEEKNEEKKLIDFNIIIKENNIINNITSLLDTETKFNFLSCNSKLIKYTKEQLKDSLVTLKLKNDIEESSSVQDKINLLKSKYKSEEFEVEIPKFVPSRGSLAVMDKLNNETHLKIFQNKKLEPPLDGIIIVYRIFFQFLKDNNLKNIKDEKLFWLEASDYILNKSNGKIGDFFKEASENFDYSPKNLYEVKKIIFGNEEKIKPIYFTKICPTTGFVTFLIKDTLEYCGLTISLKKNVPSICLNYLEYIKDMQDKIQKLIDDIDEWSNKA